MSQKENQIPMTAEIKALLLSVGSADVEDHKLILPTLKSTAGPSAGSSGSVFINSGGRRVRLNIDQNAPLKIRKLPESDEIGIYLAENSSESSENASGSTESSPDSSEKSFEKLIATGKIEPVLAHCPDQAYINLSEKCIYDCKFCSVPILQGHTKTKEESLKIVRNAFEKGPMKAISITSGVEKTPEGELERVLELMPELKKYNVPIGISIYAVSGGSKKLKDAGVSEVKYNIEVADPEIFKDVCPGLSKTDVFAELEEAVSLFGRGNVYSNLIVGLGETDESAEQTVEKLAEIGVIACIRPIYENALRKGECFMKRPSKERLLKLFEMQKRISEKYDLHPEKSETMCSLCSGCDMVPGRDD
ncbi:Biotin synthase [Methanimicrococcus sp. At1]|uniref:Biotin synthase n=1 Tax=Methanimicrococcus hacksteinii TaxID=3028293 RepID=A0ABU3VQQ2_9EURY|nr:radical SAM protein [Methanimicrococcus sp. At1]MDV0445733.1 Biotin synthase [Methanimicrococcus sp. At1]